MCPIQRRLIGRSAESFKRKKKKEKKNDVATKLSNQQHAENQVLVWWSETLEYVEPAHLG
jgi:hypothetical protein